MPDAIWCFTRTGRTAELLSLTRPGRADRRFHAQPDRRSSAAVRRGVIPSFCRRAPRPARSSSGWRSAWRAQRADGELDTVLLVTTSSSPGINRLEVHRLGREPQGGVPRLAGRDQGRRAAERVSAAAEVYRPGDQRRSGPALPRGAGDHDYDTQRRLRHADWTAVWPQSGEMVRGDARHARSSLEHYPGGAPDARRRRQARRQRGSLGQSRRWAAHTASPATASTGGANGG